MYVDKPYPVVKEVKVPHEVKVPAPYPVEKVKLYFNIIYSGTQVNL